MMFLLVIAMGRPGSSLLHCSMLDLSKLTEKRIKVVTEFLSERTR